jgi:hypothetical protein
MYLGDNISGVSVSLCLVEKLDESFEKTQFSLVELGKEEHLVTPIFALAGNPVIEFIFYLHSTTLFIYLKHF